jgi:ribosomal protein S18 acetylase RimI-like enzyme
VASWLSMTRRSSGPESMTTIRPADLSDLDRLVELFMALVDHDVALGQRRPLRWSVDPKGFARSRFSAALRTPSDYVAVAVGSLGNIVGTCHTALMEAGRPCAAHIHTLVLEQTYRGRGIGRAFLDDAFRWCAENGVDEVSLDVAPSSTRSRSFYAKYGFEEAVVTVIKKIGD